MSLTALFLICGLSLKAYDTPNDDGSSITIRWSFLAGSRPVDILRSTEPGGNFEKIAAATYLDTIYLDFSAQRGQHYYYQLRITSPDTTTRSPIVGPVMPKVQILNLYRLKNVGLILLLLFTAIIFYIRYARRVGKIFIRRIPALNAVEEAIGRATEMGKPVLYVPGINDIDDPQTIASMSILAHVAEKTAKYGTPLYVPTARSMTMTMAQQVVKEAATKVSRPDWFNIDNIRYLTDDQFGYVSAVDGIVVRERPATNFYLGAFYAESLILSETGHSVGAIQIAGTAQVDQLPFFVAACDFVLLGEELYAGSAYLSQEPVQLGSLRGQDIGKLVFIFIIVLGVLSRLFGFSFVADWLGVQQ